PVPPQGPAVIPGVRPLAADEVAVLTTRLAVLRPLAVAVPDHTQLRPILGVADPRRVLDHAVIPLLVPPVPALLHDVAIVLHTPEVVLAGLDETGQDIVEQVPLVLLDRQEVIAAALGDLPGD